jgi:hypothetical protein
MLRDAARWLSRGGDDAAADECLAIARGILTQWGCAPWIAQVDELSRERRRLRSGRPAVTLANAPSLDLLARRLRELAREQGTPIRIFGEVDVTIAELGASSSSPPWNEGWTARIMTVLRTGVGDRDDTWALFPIRTMRSSICVSISTPLVERAVVRLVLEAAEAALHAFDARSAEPSQEAEPTVVEPSQGSLARRRSLA